MSRTRTLAVFAATALSIALLAGCGSSSKSSGIKNTTTTAASNKGFDISTPEGSVSLSLNGNLPPNWPSGFPVPSGAKAAGSGSLGGSSSDVMVGVYTVSGTPSETFNFYKTNTDLTVTQSKNFGVGGAFVGSVQFDGPYSGSATVVGRNSTTYLVVVLKGSGSATTTTTTTPA
jgi:hypothetical protein